MARERIVQGGVGRSVRFDMKKYLVMVMALLLVLLALPPVTALAADQADLSIDFKPAENQDGEVVLEIGINLNNGDGGQTIERLEFRYENELIAQVDRVAAGSQSFVRSNPLGMSLISMTADLEVEVSYIDFDGSNVTRTMMVSHQAAEPKLSFKRTASATSAQAGDKIRLTYMIKNEGSALLTDLQVYDDMEGIGLIDTVEALYPGEMREFNVDVKMTKDVKSQPRVTYKGAGSAQGMVFVLESMDLVIYNPKLTVTLKSDSSAIQSGDSVSLVCNLVNEGNVTFVSATITDETLGELTQPTKIEAGKAYSWNKLIRPVNSQNYMVTVKAVDESGQVFTATSNIVAIEVAAPAQSDAADSLEATLTPNAKELDQPGEITFNVLLRNTGTQDMTDLTISDRNNQVVERINSLAPGDRVFPIAVNVTETGEYFFVVDATLASGAKVQRVTAPVTITVGVVSPSGAPTVGMEAATVSPSPLTVSKDSGGISPWLLMLLIAIVLLIIACVVVLVCLQVRANRRRRDEEDDDDYAPPAQYAPRRPAPPQQDPYDYREEISRVATEYSKPAPPPARRAPERRAPTPDEEEGPTVYKARKPSEPRTRRND
jgi:hypothetical protein